MEIRAHIQALFQHLQPEVLLSSLVGQDSRELWGAQGIPFQVDSRSISLECYIHGARAAFSERSDDELRQFYWDLSDYLQSQPAAGILSLLALEGRHLLHLYGDEPFCRLDTLLEWRDLSLDVGQDLLVCAALAQQDIENSSTHSDFCWPIAIRTNDPELKTILCRGLPENHFHLYGSTQGFPLTWGFLMNHPEMASQYFLQSAFRDNLHSGGGWGTRDNAMPWKKRIYYAAWLRALLFTQIQPGYRSPDIPAKEADKKEIFLPDFHFCMDQAAVVRRMVETARFLYGVPLQQNGNKKYCLDYAIPPQMDQTSSVRFLSGERRFLYDCFRQCFSGRFSQTQKNLFYLYLLLKQSFRGEVIQTNRRYGFRNFASYTHRKDLIWGNRMEYWFEAVRLAINATLEQHISSLELRIVPGKTRQKILQQVFSPDQISQYQIGNDHDTSSDRRQRSVEQDQVFYVLHYAKTPLPRLTQPPKPALLTLRHGKYRRMVERQAQVIAASLERNSYLCARIRGIDAASHEIGCRPEIFAPAFRFLRHFPVRSNLVVHQERYWPTLAASYHVGEDFLDLPDGLRAIDEAVCFLDLERGDRLGHALALGVEPEEFYHLKGYRVVLPAQDLLDNLVWLQFRSLEWGVAIPNELHSRLKYQAESLLQEIYGNVCPNVTLQEYFQSWTLRGDSPELYYNFYPEDNDSFFRHLQIKRYSASRFDAFRINNHIWSERNLNTYRANGRVRNLVHCYQYHNSVRWAGQKNQSYQVNPDYIRLVRLVQDCMMQRLMAHGICIECNPSSNYLIGTFRRYDKHPIFRFNSYNLNLPGKQNSNGDMQVSINTDDQSVFDTSLEYEYALLYCGMSQYVDENGVRQISNDAADRYLEHVRTMSASMVFAKAVKQLRYRFLP